jgi:hypothetical protein
MMKEEFEKRINLVITAEEYETIEAAYMGMPENVNKDKFAKMWLKEGGIQDLFNKRQIRIQNLMDIVKNLEEQNIANADWLHNREETVAEYARENKALREKLATIGAVVTAA